jgi:hypothetical protein
MREFDPTPDWGSNAEYAGQYRRPAIALKELTRANSHSFTGYLENPRVAADICWALGTKNKDAPPYDPAKLVKRLQAFSEKTIGGNGEKAWKKAQELRQKRDLTSFWEFVRVLDEFESFLEKFAESITD